MTALLDQYGRPIGDKSKTRVTAIRESDLGIYVWERACNGKVLANQNNEVLSITSEYGDISKMAILEREARRVCIKEGIDPEGRAIFWEAHKVTDEELAEQEHEFSEGIWHNTNIRSKW